jgi:hypothetical protein
MRVFGLGVRRLLAPVIAGWAPALAVGGVELLVRVAVPSALAPWQTLAMQLGCGGAVYLSLMWRSESEIALAAKARLHRLAPVGGAR